MWHEPGLLLHLADRLKAAVAAAMQKTLWEYELSPLQAAVLLAMPLTGDRPTVTGLADHCGMQQPTTTKVLDALEAAGLVERHPCPTDRRLVLVGLTQSGTRAATVLWSRCRDAEAKVLEQMRKTGDAERLAVALAGPVRPREVAAAA